jgi:hypothetical protein
MAWYHSGIGFFVNSTLTMASVYLGVWLIFVFALAGALTVRSGNSVSDVTDAQLISTVNTVQIFQLGLLSVIPYWGELCLESGFLNVCTFSCTPSRAQANSPFEKRCSLRPLSYSPLCCTKVSRYLTTGVQRQCV